MKIKLGDMGGMVAGPAQQGSTPEAAFVKGDAFAGLAATLNQVAAREAAERRQKEGELRRAKSIEAYAGFQADTDDLTDDIAKRLERGEVKRDEVEGLYTEGLAERRAARLAGLDQEQQALVGAQFHTAERRGNLLLRRAMDNDLKREGIATLNMTAEEYQRIGVREPERAIEQWSRVLDDQGPGLIGKDEIAKQKQSFAERTFYTHFASRIGAAREDGETLKAIEGEIAGNETLDPDRKNKLLGDVTRFQMAIAAKADLAERRLNSAIERQAQRLGKYVENGLEIPPAEFDSFVRATKGTAYEGMAQAILAEQKAVSELAGLPPEKLIGRLQELQTRYGPTPTLEQVAHMAKVRAFTERTMKILNESPLDYAAQREGSKIEPLDIANPASWAQNLASRTLVVSELAGRTGASPKGLYPGEVQAISAELRRASVADKQRILGFLAQGFGTDEAGMRVFKATMGQIAPDDPVLASAGLDAFRGIDAQGGRTLAEKVIRGQEILRGNHKEDGKPAGGKLLPMPSDGDMMKVFASRAGRAFADNPEAGSLFFQRARAVYAADSSTDGDGSGVLNSSRWDAAIDQATGGFARHNSREIVLPQGVPYGTFKDGVRARVEHLVAQGRVPGWTTGQLMGLPMRNVGDGRYEFLAGDGVVATQAGERLERVTIDFNVSAPYATSGSAPDTRPVTKKGRSNPGGR